MKLSERTIPYIPKIHAIILKTLLKTGELSTASLRLLIEKGQVERVSVDFSLNTIRVGFSTLCNLGILKRVSYGNYKLSDVEATKSIVELLDSVNWSGLTPEENTAYNYADMFLLKCSPDNALVSGEGGFVYNPVSGNASVYYETFDFELLERFETDGFHYNYRLSDTCYKHVLVWREITRLLNSFKLKETK